MILLLVLAAAAVLAACRWLWRMDRAEWTPADQAEFEQHVAEQRGQR